MLNNVLLLHYNNYYNRIVKSEDSVNDYRLADTVSEVGRYKDLNNVNFVPGDGVTTKLVIGKGDMSDLELSSYDYVVVYNKDENNNESIMHRWFILEYNRTRGGQYEISLKRDVIVDYEDAIKQAPIFVDKAIIQDENNPLLFNHEQVQVNQIKTSEMLLKDTTNVPWLVMYLKKNTLGNSNIGTSGVITVNSANPKQANIEINTPIAQWSYYQYKDTEYTQVQEGAVEYKTDFRRDSSIGVGYYSYVYIRNNFKGTINEIMWPDFNHFSSLKRPNNSTFELDAYDDATEAVYSSKLIPDTLALNSGYHDISEATSYNALNGKIIKDSDGKYFEIQISSGAPSTDKYTLNPTANPTFFDDMTDIWQSVYGTGTGNVPNNYSFKINVPVIKKVMKLIPREDLQETINFNSISTSVTTQDSPLFDAICLPYGEFPIRVNNQMIYTNAGRSLQLMCEVARQLSSNYVLDLQLLPYCPMQDKVVALSYLDIKSDVNTGLKCMYQNDLVDFIPIVERATFTFDIAPGISEAEYEDYQYDVPYSYKKKFYNDCTMQRLCSPNYTGVFEFNVSKNGGVVELFNVDMTLRPYNPYIHVNPKFDLLYGQDFDDARGLICGGDFSLGIINDAWVQYEIQNKNYQAIFDRQIQNLDVNNKINKEEAQVSAILGVGQGAMRGAVAGGIVGGGYGAAAGAVLGGAASALGGAYDMYNIERRQKEARDFAIDNFNLQLGNVRALPNSITKTSALTANNKLFPFVEFYQCTSVEKSAYFNKIKYDGMTIGIIDKLDNYLVEGEKNFFKGQLIRCEEIQEDNHMLEEINKELAKGVYI